MVVLCVDCPATELRMVILKSPVIGASLTGFRWAEVMAETKDIALKRAANKNSLAFINDYSLVEMVAGERSGNYQKAWSYSRHVDPLRLKSQ
jgi:hypothetical protein